MTRSELDVQGRRRRATRAQGPAAGDVTDPAPQRTDTAEQAEAVQAPEVAEETTRPSLTKPGRTAEETTTAATSVPAAEFADDGAAEAAVPEAGADDSSPAPRRQRPRAVTLVGAAGAVLLVVALAAAAVLLLRTTATADEDARREAFVQTARQGVLNLTNVRHDTAAEDVQNLLAGASGTFADEFSAGKDSYIQVVQQAQVDSIGTIQASGLERLEGSTGVVLVASSAKVSNSSTPQAEDRSYRLRVTVVDDGDRMTVSKVDFVP